MIIYGYIDSSKGKLNPQNDTDCNGKEGSQFKLHRVYVMMKNCDKCLNLLIIVEMVDAG